jgi:uncharacterized membrane protein
VQLWAIDAVRPELLNGESSGMTYHQPVGRVKSFVTPERNGDPVHPMIVPFPIAFLTAALATDVAAMSTRDPFWSRASRLLLGAGIASGLAAGALGAIDYYTIRRAREKPAGRLHAHGNIAALALAGLNLAARTRRAHREPHGMDLALSATTAAVLGVTGWAGGELSYRHMVGVDGHGDQHSDDEKRWIV